MLITPKDIPAVRAFGCDSNESQLNRVRVPASGLELSMGLAAWLA